MLKFLQFKFSNNVKIIITVITLLTFNLNAYCGENINDKVKKNKYKTELAVFLDFADIQYFLTNFGLKLSRKFTLYNSGSELLSANFIELGAGIEGSFFSVAGGPYITIAPVSFFEIKFEYHYYYGTREIKFNSIYDDIYKSIIINKQNNDSENAASHRFSICPTLKVKIKSFFFQNTSVFYYVYMDFAEVYYNVKYDHLQKNGFNFTNYTTMGVFINNHLIVAVTNFITKVHGNGYIKDGLILNFILQKINFISNKDKIFISIGYYVKDKYRIFDDSSIKGFIANVVFVSTFNL